MLSAGLSLYLPVSTLRRVSPCLRGFVPSMSTFVPILWVYSKLTATTKHRETNHEQITY